MEFMFRCGAFLELPEEIFTEWAVDLASLTLLIAAFIEGKPFVEWSHFDRVCGYSALPYDIFFRGHDEWPNAASINEALEGFPEFRGEPVIYAERLMQARGVLGRELRSVGTELSTLNQLERRIEDCGGTWGIPEDQFEENFHQCGESRERQKVKRITSRMYRYELRRLADEKREVICHDLELGTSTPLPERPDLFGRYRGTFAWGYAGEGPKFLTVSMLAHHFGHDQFGRVDAERLLQKWISRLPERLVETSLFITTEQIDCCLTE